MSHQRRVRRVTRLLMLVFVLGYFFAPWSIKAFIPLWLPFLCALGLEVHFFVSGYWPQRPHETTSRSGGSDRVLGPQDRDLQDFGYANRTVEVALNDDTQLRLRVGDLSDEDVEGWLEEQAPLLATLAPGLHELILTDPVSPPLPYHPPPAAPRRGIVRRGLEGLAVLAVLAAALLLISHQGGWQKLPATTRASVTATLSREASRIAGHPAHVQCDTSGKHVGIASDADGLAQVGGQQAWLTPAICYSLYQVIAGKPGADISPQSGQALAVFAHESWHLHGEASEALANCYGYQSAVDAGIAFGLTRTSAWQLEREQLADNASDFQGAPAYLVPSGCHNGGQYDLHPANARFP
jgi:hypothetical protein